MGVFDEKTFLKEFKHNPNAAFGQLMAEYRDRVFLLCRRVTKSGMEADDLAQEAFIRIWKGLKNFKGDSSISTWIYRVGWNVCATHLGKKGKGLFTTSLDEGEGEDWQAPGERVGSDDQGYKDFENQQLLEKLFDRIPASHQLLLTLYYLKGQSYQEIVDVTGMAMGSVKATLHRAKARLRTEALEELGQRPT